MGIGTQPYGAPHPAGEMPVDASLALTTAYQNVLAAPPAGFCYQITCIILDNSDAATKVGVTLNLGDRERGPIPAPANGGAIAIPFQPPLSCADASALQAKTIGSATTVTITVVGYLANSKERKGW